MSDHGDSGGHGSAPTSTGTHSPPSLVSLPVSRSRGPYGQKIPRHLTAGVKIRPPTSHLLETQDFSANENGFYFQSKAEADLSMTQAQWYSPANDSSMPQTDAEDRRVVGQLLSAAKNMSRAKDTLASAYRKKTNGYPDWAMEACAWDVLFIAKSIHMEGFRAPLYDAPLMDAIGETRFWTFQDRIDWICEALMTSKNVVVNLMKKEKLLTIVGAPQKLYIATLVNTRSNASRGIWVKNGREADEEHQSRANGKRVQVDGTPLPFSKRQKMDEKRVGNAAFSAAPIPVAGRECQTLPDTNPPPQAGRPSNPFIPYRPSTSAPIMAPPKTADVAMANPPRQQITSFALDALNAMVTSEKKPARDKSGTKAETTSTTAATGSVDAVALHNPDELHAARVLASLQQSGSSSP